MKTSAALANAQKLFELDIRSYPDLQAAHESLLLCRPVYDIFIEFQKAIKDWSQLIWVDLDLSIIEKGSEKWVQQLSEFSSELQALPIHRSIFTFLFLYQFLAE